MNRSPKSPRHSKHSQRRKSGGFKPSSNSVRRPPPIVRKQYDPQQLAHAAHLTSIELRGYAQARLASIEAAQSRPSPSASQLDPWQKDAVDALTSRHHVVVDAPTTAGKTRVVEAYFAKHINDSSFRACYTCPVKSLSNDKLREFRELFGHDKVGIATGDFKENLGAPIIVSTLETYRNSLLGIEPDLGRQLVVFDEYHFIKDESRGSAWEEAIILTPPTCQLLLLSASIANADEFAVWLEKLTHRVCQVIHVEKRPVPLTNLVWMQDHWVSSQNLPPAFVPDRRQVRFDSLQLPTRVLASRIAGVDAIGLTPCLVYASRRLFCHQLAFDLGDALEPMRPEMQDRVRKRLHEIDELTKALTYFDRDLLEMMITKGVSYHHSGHTPVVRVAIETLVKEGLLRFCVATMGLSLGINFSVRSTLISDAVRPGERGPSLYSPTEILQMTGRAGRRGKDPIGFCIWPSIDSYALLANPKRERAESNLRKNPTTFLGLLSRGFSLEQIEEFYTKSFLSFSESKAPIKLLTKAYIESQIGKKAPCFLPAHEFAAYSRNHRSICGDCPVRKSCHATIKKISSNSIASMQLHLHRIEAIGESGELTPFGELARHFPQFGGLLIARMIQDGKISGDNLMQASQLLAALSLARFKRPGSNNSYRFPYKRKTIGQDLEKFYPYYLFPEEYDPPMGAREFPVIRDYNPGAGFLISEWANGITWDDLQALVANENFGAGDITNVIFRVASYLQAVVALKNEPLSNAAVYFRDELLRDPITVN